MQASGAGQIQGVRYGIPKSVGADFIAATPAGAKLPEKAPKQKKLGDEF